MYNIFFCNVTMAEPKDVIVDVPDMSEKESLIQVAEEVVNDVIAANVGEAKEEGDNAKESLEEVAESLEDVVERADEVVDNAVNEVVNNIVEKANDAVEEIKNEETKVAAKVALSVVNELIDDKENVIDKATDKVFETLLEKAKEVGVKKSTLALLIKYVMEAVEDTPVKGPEQKDYALRLIRSLVLDLAEGDDKEYLLIAIDSGSVADTIDLIVAASKGELNVNMVVETAATSCLPCFMSIFSKRAKKADK